jgi:hypothetical protein
MTRTIQSCVIGAVLLLTTSSVSFGQGSIQPPTTVDAQMGTLTQGVAGSATFPITVMRDHNGTVTVSFTVTFTGPLPTGAGFNAPDVTSNGNTSPIPATATFTTTAATPAGSYPFQITASDGTNMVTSNTQTLLVSPSTSVPEIDPGAASGALTVIAGLYLMFKDRRSRRKA